MNGIVLCLSFFVWLISLMSSKFMHVLAGVRVSFLFKVEEYSIVWMDHTMSSIHTLMARE